MYFLTKEMKRKTKQMEKKILANFKLKRTKLRKKVIVNIDHTMSQRIASLARTFFCGKKVRARSINVIPE